MATPTFVTLANANQHNQVNSGTANSFTTAVDVSPGGSVLGQAFQTQAEQLYPGQMFRFWASGSYSSSGSPGFSVGLYYGGAAGSPICYGSVSVANSITGATSLPWMLHAQVRVTGVGTTGSLYGVGHLLGMTSAGTPLMMPNNGGLVADTSVSKIITVASTCGSSSVSNVMTCMNWSIEYLTEP